jgi:hypothetical protein
MSGARRTVHAATHIGIWILGIWILAGLPKDLSRDAALQALEDEPVEAAIKPSASCVV